MVHMMGRVMVLGHHLEVLEFTNLLLNYWVKLIQLQFDDRDGELRASVELPLEDAPLTLPQLARCLTDLANFVDRFDPMLRQTMREGGVRVPRDPLSYQR